MAATVSNGQRQRSKASAHRSQTQYNLSDSEIFGVPRSPSPTTHQSPLGSANSIAPMQRSHKTYGPQNNARRPKKDAAGTKADIFDLPISDDERTTLAKQSALHARLSKQKSPKLDQKIAPSSKDAERHDHRFQSVPQKARSRPVPQVLGKVESGKAVSNSNAKPSKPVHIDVFDLPSSGEETPKPKVANGSKIKSKLKPTKSAKLQQSLLYSSHGGAIEPAASASLKSSLYKKNKPQSSQTQSPQKLLASAEAVALSLPVRHVASTTNKPIHRSMARHQSKPSMPEPQAKPIHLSMSAPTALPTMLEEQTTAEAVTTAAKAQPRNSEVRLIDSSRSRTTRTVTPEPLKHKGIDTPKQKALWGRLLDSIDVLDSPSDLSVTTLSLSTTRKRPNTRDGHGAIDYEDATPRKRVKLVNALKHSTFESVVEEDSVDMSSPSASESESDGSEDDTPTVTNESQISQKRIGNASGKITYSQQRSYLAEQSEESMLDAMIEEMSQPVTRSLEVSQKDNFDLESEDDSGDDAGQPKSAHDLRATGTKKRMLQDLENLISGLELENPGVSSKRADLIEISNAMLTPGTAELILDHGMDRQVASTFTKSQDDILSFIGLCCMSLLVETTKQLTILRGFIRAGILEKVFELLQKNTDMNIMIKERTANMSGIAQRKVLALRDAILKTDIWAEYPPKSMSLQLAALRLLELIVKRMAELGSEDVLLDEDHLSIILGLIHQHQTTADGITIDWLAFSIFKSISVGAYVSKRGPWSGRAVRIAASALPRIFTEDAGRRQSIHLTVLSFMMNITNDNEKACEVVAKQSISSPICARILRGFESKIEPEDEALVLSLGVMINLAELSDSARFQVLSEASSTLRQLIVLFSNQFDASRTVSSQLSAQRNVAYGYLALWLVNLCQNSEVRTMILQCLPGTSELQGLIQTAETFVAAHQQTEMEMSADLASQQERGQRPAYSKRLKETLDKLKAAATA